MSETLCNVASEQTSNKNESKSAGVFQARWVSGVFGRGGSRCPWGHKNRPKFVTGNPKIQVTRKLQGASKLAFKSSIFFWERFGGRRG